MGQTKSKNTHLENCPVRIENEDASLSNAYDTFRNTSLFDGAVVFYQVIKSGSFLEIQELSEYVLQLFLHTLIEERVVKSLTLENPWKLFENVDPPNLFLLQPRKCLKTPQNICFIRYSLRGKIITIPSYYWIDDFYYTSVCQCCELKRIFLERLRRTKEPVDEKERVIYQYACKNFIYRLSNHEPITKDIEEEEYKKFLENKSTIHIY